MTEQPIASPMSQGPTGRTHDPEGVRRNILEIATAEFAERGFSGARVDEIAAKTSASKRMIYYYFKDKEGLFIAVLEAAYAGIRNIELGLDLDGLSPVEALRRLAEFTFDYQNANPDFVRLVMVENIHNGIHIDRSERMQSLNVSVLHVLDEVYRRGVGEGVFRDKIDIIDLHMTISALSFFNVSNRSTFSKIFKRDMVTPAALAARRQVVAETVVRFALSDARPGIPTARRRKS
ncbi:MAG TPA: TetR/AcrR family transcriptional regulator [Acetobacteraceae bacterium]|nr:TetR/AcrR family transcriptional regulator [Acetobacteraceae bacterium]